MPNIVPVVEGDGEVAALPILLRSLLYADEAFSLQISAPKNAHGKTNLTKIGGVERFANLAARERDCAAILIVIDSDRDCPVALACQLAGRLRGRTWPVPIAIVVAQTEYECWFVASIETIARRLPLRDGADCAPVQAPDEMDGPKSWLSRRMVDGRSYKETLDQAPLTAAIDIALAEERSPSFRRLRRALRELVAKIDSGDNGVSPPADRCAGAA